VILTHLFNEQSENCNGRSVKWFDTACFRHHWVRGLRLEYSVIHCFSCPRFPSLGVRDLRGHWNTSLSDKTGTPRLIRKTSDFCLGSTPVPDINARPAKYRKRVTSLDGFRLRIHVDGTEVIWLLYNSGPSRWPRVNAQHTLIVFAIANPFRV
jgi:hypothetical protein